MPKIKIVTDSSSDVLSLNNIDFASAPLKIVTQNKEYIDNSELDTLQMVNFLAEYKGKSSTSCPNPQDWLTAFGDADEIFCITITATLSGSYNAALSAKEIYEEKYPERKVFVINSLSTGPEMKLIIEKISELVSQKTPYEKICDEIIEYSKNTHLLFMLECMKNLANNGRVSHLVAKAAGLLGIRVIGKASAVGDLETLDKCRGRDKSIISMFQNVKNLGYKGGKLRIAHCFNEEAAKQLHALILKEFSTADIEIYNSRGLCSFYAEKGGILVGFES